MPNEFFESIQTTGDKVPIAFEELSDDEFDLLMEQTVRSYAGRKSIPLTDIHRNMEILLGNQ